MQAAAHHWNLSGAGGLGSDQFQAVLSHSPTSISLAPEILSSLDIPGARGDAGDKETQVLLLGELLTKTAHPGQTLE